MDENLNNNNLDDENLNESEENKEETREEVQTSQEEVKETIEEESEQTDEQPSDENAAEETSSQDGPNFTMVDEEEPAQAEETAQTSQQEESGQETVSQTEKQDEESQQETASQPQQQTQEKPTIDLIEKTEINRQEAVNPKEKKEKKESSFNGKQFIVTLVLCILVSIVSSFATVKLVSNDESTVIYVNNSSGDTTTQTVVSSDYTDVVDMVADSVVEVYTEEVTYSNGYGSYISEGAGSGVIFTSDGYIVTNAHVIEDASTITVTLHNGDTYEASLVASDTQSDIAVLKIDADNLTPVVIGDSDSLKVGQFCIAIGNPLGTLGGTVTAGIISALERQVTVDDIPMNLLQINVSVSPGNSGGGLFNTSGELIGIVNAKSTSENSEGIGFAIPVNDVVEVATELISQGYVSGRPMLGITCVSIESIQTAWSYGVNTYGVYVVEITEECTANAGLEVGDVITGFDEVSITCYDDLKSALYYFSAGDTVRLTVVRGNETLEIEVTLVQKQ